MPKNRYRGILCLFLITFSNALGAQMIVATVTQIEPVANQTVKLKILRQSQNEHFGIGASGGLRKVPGIEKAVEAVNPNTFAAQKGSSMWVVEGGLTVILSYEPKAGDPAPKEIWIEGLPTQNGVNNLIAVLCCCDKTEGNCQLKNNNGVINSTCTGGNCCGQTIGLVDPGGFVKLIGNGCKSEATAPALPAIERH